MRTTSRITGIPPGRRRMLAALAAGAVVLAGCSKSGSDDAKPTASTGEPSGQSTLQAAKQSGSVRIGYANEAPFAYMDTGSGQLTGESVEIARAVLKRMGIDKVEGVLTEFGSLIPGLQAKRFDVIAAGMYVTPERCKQVVFSNPTYGVDAAFLVKQGNPKQLHSYQDVAAKQDAKLGVVVGAIEAQYASKTGVQAGQMVVFPDAASALAGVQAGRADAYAATALTVNDLMKKSAATDLERAQPFTNPTVDGKSVRGYGAFAFRQQDQDFADAFNAELANFLGSPEHRKLVEPFGFTEAELPKDMTAAQLCGG